MPPLPAAACLAGAPPSTAIISYHLNWAFKWADYSLNPSHGLTGEPRSGAAPRARPYIATAASAVSQLNKPEEGKQRRPFRGEEPGRERRRKR
ncbi:hypothetical protein ACP70R_017335 [Stipagrostis hirtigluma subsp. patula]